MLCVYVMIKIINSWPNVAHTHTLTENANQLMLASVCVPLGLLLRALRRSPSICGILLQFYNCILTSCSSGLAIPVTLDCVSINEQQLQAICLRQPVSQSASQTLWHRTNRPDQTHTRRKSQIASESS